MREIPPGSPFESAAAFQGAFSRVLGEAGVIAARRRRSLRVRWSDKRGSVAVMTAMLAVALIGFSALAVDVGTWEVNKGAMQGAADQAALAAGLAMSAGRDAAQKEAKGLAAAYGFVDAGAVSVAVNIPPTTGSYVRSANAVEVVITQLQPRLLSGVLLKTSPTAAVRAVAVPGQASACIMALNPTKTGISGSGLGTIDAGACNIYVNSPDACDVSLSGSVAIKGFDVFLGRHSQNSCASGSANVTASNQMHLDAAPASDPYASRTIPTPSPTCMPKVDTKPAIITLDPGTYCDGFSLSGKTVNLNSGVYIFNSRSANISTSGTNVINGTNVTLVFTGDKKSGYAEITKSGTLNLNLTPMTTGPTAGISLWLDGKGGVDFDPSGTTNLNITGAFYAPNSKVGWSGNMNSRCTQLIADSIVFSGTSNFQHDCSGLGVSDVGGASGYTLLE